MLNKNKESLLDILESIEKIESFIKDFKSHNEFYMDKLHFDAVLMNFVNIGEAVVRLTKEFTDKYIEVEWIKIKGLRNIVAHDYFGVDPEEIWQIIKTKIPDLKNKVNNIVEEMGEG